MGGIDDAVCLLVGATDHLGLVDQTFLLRLTLRHSASVGVIAGGDETVRLSLGALGEAASLPPGIRDGAVCGVIGVGDHGVGVVGGILDHGVGLTGGTLQDVPGLDLGILDEYPGPLPGLTEHIITVIEHILGIIKFGGQGITQIIQQCEHLLAGNHAVGGHGNAIGPLDVMDQCIK